jgi:DNA-binding NtrC family response regulator
MEMNAQSNIPSPNDSLPDGGEIGLLVVDDEPGCRETLRDVLAEMGYRAESAATGQQALALLRERFFHAAILDVRLPDMNGTELLTRLKELHPDTVAIMVTGYASLQTSIRATNAGAAAYVLKPLDFEQLVSLLQQALDQQRSLLEERRLFRESQERIRDLEASEHRLAERVQHLEQELAAQRGT